MEQMGTTDSVSARAQKIVDEFASLQTWEDRYKRIIERGKALESLPEALKSDELKIRGCQSQVWLQAVLNDDKRVIFRADSDAMIVKGLISILVSIYSGAPPSEIMKHSPEFLKELGFSTHLSPSRANGLLAMLKQIHHYALAFSTILRMHEVEATKS